MDRMASLGYNYRKANGKPRKIPAIEERDEHRFYNKATAFYWTPLAYQTNNCRCPLILGGIWNAWFEASGKGPQIQVEEFFAAPVSVDDSQARTIPEILCAHKYVCAQVRRGLGWKKTRAWNTVDKTWCTYHPRYFRLLPLCEALMAVFDEYMVVSIKKHADGSRHYEDVVKSRASS
jgi:hypothetical protein